MSAPFTHSESDPPATGDGAATTVPKRHWPAEIALTVLAIAGTLCLVALLAALVFDLRPIVFRSDSMAPAIPARSLALVQSRPASDLAVGDVVSVHSTSGSRITHRIVGMEPTAEGVSLQLKGDSNAEPDAQPYLVDEADRVVWSAPGLGQVVAITQSTPFVFFAGVCLGVAGLAIVRPRGRRPDKPSETQSGPPSGTATSGSGPKSEPADSTPESEPAVAMQAAPTSAPKPATRSVPKTIRAWTTRMTRRLTPRSVPKFAPKSAPSAKRLRLQRRSAAAALAIVTVLAGAQAVEPVDAAFTDASYFSTAFTVAASGNSEDLLLARTPEGQTYATDSVDAAIRSDGASTWTDAAIPPFTPLFLAAASGQVMAMNATQFAVLDLTTGNWGATKNLPNDVGTPTALTGGLRTNSSPSYNQWTLISGESWWSSTNAGVNWEPFTPNGLPTSGTTSTPTLLASDGDHIVTVDNSSMYYSSDGGLNFTAGPSVGSPPLGITATPTSLAYSVNPTAGDSSVHTLVYATQWYRLSHNLGSGQMANNLAAHPAPTALTGGGGGIFVSCSSDAGTCHEINETGPFTSGAGPSITEIGWPW